MRFRTAGLVVGVAAVQGVLGAGPLQIYWTTDISTNFNQEHTIPATFGPDGPWQAAVLQIGTFKLSKSTGSVFAPVWPSGSYLVQILDGPAPQSNYTTKNSTSAVSTRTTLAQSDSWWSDTFMNDTFEAKMFYDVVSLNGKTGSASYKANASVAAATEWSVPAYPGGASYTASVGILGLGPEDSVRAGDDAQGSILQQLKVAGDIPSQSFSMHIGSAAHGQPGSLVLGGYEENRVVGPVATLRMQGAQQIAFLVDVVLGVETGGSPWNGSVPGSVYMGNDASPRAVEIVKQLGGVAGASVMTPNAASPMMYMPPSTCREAAKHLPVTWDERLQLYLWNVNDPQYARIVRSPAYMGVVLSDSDAKNVTIKVPFALLNLTLDKPIVDTPTPYFPCKPFDGDTLGFWQLGRAFLQAAFMAVDFDANATYLAQAPGPGMAQSVIKPINVGDTAASFLAKPASEFARSWSGAWEVLPADGTSADGSTEGGASGDKGLSAGGIAGIVIGVVAGLFLLGLPLFCMWRRKKRQNLSEKSTSADAANQPHEYYTPKGPGELDGQHVGGPRHEMEVPHVTHEAPQDNPVYELPNSHAGTRPSH